MIQTKNAIMEEIVSHMRTCESNTRNWYVGIASDPDDRLFNEHNVNKESDCWIHRDAGDEETARQIEQEIIEQYSTQGGTGGGDHKTTQVYAFRITSSTRED